MNPRSGSHKMHESRYETGSIWSISGMRHGQRVEWGADRDRAKVEALLAAMIAKYGS